MNAMQKPDVSIAFIHHANQFLITDGYENREGISSIVGTRNSKTGLLYILELHRRYQVPLNLNISGTLMEALAWHRPDFFSDLKGLAKLDLLELLGSSYGQNMMKFFSMKICSDGSQKRLKYFGYRSDYGIQKSSHLL
jgi:hypothetical protein